jgi:hypothetical protein
MNHRAMKRQMLYLRVAALLVGAALKLPAQSATTNLVAITIVGFTPAEIVRLIQPPVISIEAQSSIAGLDKVVHFSPGNLKISPFTIERNYSPADASWRNWANSPTGEPTRHATLAFLASPGNVVNTLEFLDCWPVGYSIGPNTQGVLVERLTLRPEWIPWP